MQYIEKYKRNIAVDMRKKGMSYSEIKDRINVPKSTLSFWLRDLKLTQDQKEKLNQNRLHALRRGSEKRILKTKRIIEEIKTSSAENIKEISKRELWLMGIILYWRERFLNGNETDLKKGVKFTSSDPYLIKLFLKWLKDIGRIKDEDIEFDILIGPGDSQEDSIRFWTDVTGYREDYFTRFYFYKIGKNTTRKSRKKRNSDRTKYGLLRIRVKASSMLARQIYGWVRGIIKYYWE